ncbi:DUF1361 domain-containing protein [Janibacter limosus]|uniref:DUF1361 domain-containing protein n=1 Tax=Janibacter limosus TaxID=53458 RepID=UPI0035DC64D2|nr:DUF1361 domain-containing protein [Janibacter limosus]
MAQISHPGRWLTGLTMLLVAGTLVAAGLQDVRAERAGAPVFAFLFWNLFLARVPYVLALVMTGLHRARASGWLLGAIGVVWLAFLPNAPYILTDFIHLGAIPGAPRWFDALLIGSFAGTGLLLGLASLLLVHHVVEARVGRVAGWALAIGSLALSSIGIYPGRFPRFNSRDILTNPHGLLEVIAYRLADPLGNPFLLQFGVLMTGGLVLSYLATWGSGRALAGGRRTGVAQYGG